MVLGLSPSTARAASEVASSRRNSCAPIWALDVAANAVSPKSKAAGFAISIIASFSNSACCPRYNLGRSAAVSDTRVRMDHAAAAPEIADHTRKDRIGRSNIVRAAATHPAEPEHIGH